MRVSQEIVLKWVKTRAIVTRKPYKKFNTFCIDASSSIIYRDVCLFQIIGKLVLGNCGNKTASKQGEDNEKQIYFHCLRTDTKVSTILDQYSCQRI